MDFEFIYFIVLELTTVCIMWAFDRPTQKVEGLRAELRREVDDLRDQVNVLALRFAEVESKGHKVEAYVAAYLNEEGGSDDE